MIAGATLDAAITVIHVAIAAGVIALLLVALFAMALGAAAARGDRMADDAIQAERAQQNGDWDWPRRTA